MFTSYSRFTPKPRDYLQLNFISGAASVRAITSSCCCTHESAAAKGRNLLAQLHIGVGRERMPEQAVEIGGQFWHEVAHAQFESFLRVATLGEWTNEVVFVEDAKRAMEGTQFGDEVREARPTAHQDVCAGQNVAEMIARKQLEPLMAEAMLPSRFEYGDWTTLERSLMGRQTVVDFLRDRIITLALRK